MFKSYYLSYKLHVIRCQSNWHFIIFYDAFLNPNTIKHGYLWTFLIYSSFLNEALRLQLIWYQVFYGRILLTKILTWIINSIAPYHSFLATPPFYSKNKSSCQSPSISMHILASATLMWQKCLVAFGILLRRLLLKKCWSKHILVDCRSSFPDEFSVLGIK